MRETERILGYDTSESAYDLSVICFPCSEENGDRHGSILYVGDDWGGPLPRCEVCGDVMDELTERPSGW